MNRDYDPIHKARVEDIGKTLTNVILTYKFVPNITHKRTDSELNNARNTFNSFDFLPNRIKNSFNNIIKKILKEKSVNKRIKLLGLLVNDNSRLAEAFNPPKNGGYLKGGIYYGGDNTFDKTFRFLSNQYRSRFCDGRARPLLGDPQEIHPLCANFIGPYTHIWDPYVRSYPPFNDVDAAARQHDIDYYNAMQLPTEQQTYDARRVADDNFLAEVAKYPSEEPYYSIAKYGIGAKVAAENLAPEFIKYISPGYFGQPPRN